MRKLSCGSLVLALASLSAAEEAAPSPGDGPHVIVVVGAPGAPEFGVQFDVWATQWQETAEALGGPLQLIGRDEAGDGDKERLKAALLARAAAAGGAPLWLVFLGHGTYGGERAKFNLRGADVSAEELAAIDRDGDQGEGMPPWVVE